MAMECAQRSGRYSQSLASVRVVCGRTGVSCGAEVAQRQLSSGACNAVWRFRRCEDGYG